VKHRTHDQAMAALFQQEPAFALDLLNSVLADGDQAELQVVLRQLVKAVGGVQVIADKAHLGSSRVYRSIAADADPALSNFRHILDAMGMRLTVAPKVHYSAHG